MSLAPDPLAATSNPANADPNLRPAFGPFDVQTVFYIGKSNDRDRVDYAIRLDQHCSPVGNDSVFPYWRELQHAPPVRSHPLKFFQYTAYGLSEQRVIARASTGGRYGLRLKQVDRPLVIVTELDRDRHCKAVGYVKIGGVPNARLDHIFVQLAGALSVEYVDIYGVEAEKGEALVERLRR